MPSTKEIVVVLAIILVDRYLGITDKVAAMLTKPA